MKRFRSLVVVGSSGSGKTTLVNGLRTPAFEDRVVIPHRYITRPHRLGDDLVENSHVDHPTFQSRVFAGLIDPHWERLLDGGRVERYGFDATIDADERLRVYSANNAFLRDMNPSVARTLRNGFVVVAMAAQESRNTRLGDRSPDMSDAERAVRLGDSGADMLGASVPIEIVDTTNLSPEEGQLALQAIVGTIVS